MASHMEVCHRWAADRSDLRDLKGFNIFADWSGETHTIFSYGRHFPIAAFQNDANGRRVVLLTTHERSTSTAKHKTYVWRAIPSGVPTFRVPNVRPTLASEHAQNLADYLARAAEFYAKAGRARTYGPSLMRSAEETAGEAARYAEAFNLEYTPPESLADLAAKVAETVERQREADRTAREAAAAREAERLAAQRVEDAGAFAAWQAGEPGSRCPASYWADEKGGAYMRRYRGRVTDLRSQARDGSTVDELQTSQGASVPWEHAVKAFRFMKLCRETGRTFHTNGRVVRVGHYKVDEIDSAGNMRAGCHRFTWDEAERLAREQGVFDLPADDSAVESTH